MNLIKQLLNNIKKAYQKYTANIRPEDKQKYEAYIYISLTLFTACFLGIFAIGPTLNTVSNLDKQYKDNQLVYAALHQKFINLQKLDTEYQNIQGDLEQIYSAIPKSAQIPKLTRQIENIAQQNNLFVAKYSVGSIEIYPNVKPSPIYSYNFVVNVSGQDIDVNQFIADIINFDRIVGIDKITTGRTQETQSTVFLTGRVFFATK